MKQFYLLLFGLFLIQFSFGQIGFQDKEVTNFTSGLIATKFADIDNDGDLDLISYSSSLIDWYENKSPEVGYRRRKNVTTEVSLLNAIDTFDFDGDEDIDVISASIADDKLAWYENIDGLGTFGSQQLIATIDLIRFVEMVDMDGDSDKDLVYVAGNTNSGYNIIWLENSDSLPDNFTIEHFINNNFMNVSFANYFVDLDNDGDVDVLLNFTGGLAWMENIGSGIFNDIVSITSASVIGSTNTVDFDGDGDIDLINYLQESGGNRKIVLFENNGLGSFGSAQVIFQNLDGSARVVIQDIDNDGDYDLIQALSTGNYYHDLIVYENINGQIQFGNPQQVAESIYLLGSFESLDIDNDGDNDILTNVQSNEIGAYYNLNGDGFFGSKEIIAAGAMNASSVATADFDNDGDLDILSASYDDDKIAWYETINSNDFFGSQRIISQEASSAKAAVAADMDGDGDQDVISISGPSTSGHQDKISWYENLDGLGNFGSQINIPIGIYDSPDGLRAYDIDNDGDNDVVTTISNWPQNDKIVWYENIDGLGNFSTENIISTDLNGANTILEVDIDNDGDYDLLSASRLDTKVSWYQNLDGFGNFGTQQIIANNAIGVFGVSAADFDGDGDQDVVYMSNGSTDAIVWHENIDGQGTFGPQLIITTNIDVNGSTAIVAADIDTDGDQDVIASSRPVSGGSAPDKIIWLENLNGLGNFDLPKLITSNCRYPSSILVVDIDNDGDNDVLASSRYDDKISWHENLGVVYNTIMGSVRIDIEGNGCDTSDRLLPNILVTTNDGSNIFSTFTLSNEFEGMYQIAVSEGDYLTSIVFSVPQYFMISPTSHDSNFVGYGNIDIADFCIEPLGAINDLNITIYPSINDPRPGFNTTYQIVYKNIGTTQLSGSVSFEFDNSKLNFLNASETVSSQTVNTLNFNFTNLNPFETRTIDLEFNVFAPPTNSIGDELVSVATINPVSGDNTEEDNTFSLNQTVIGSYDPNDITCLEGDEILLEDADKYLHYLIRFQNTGTASAVNVRVENVLDDKLDWTTMQLESLSHNGRVEILNGSEVSFIFNGINLPDSTSDEPNSHGFIAYKIKPLDNVTVGDIFYNTADIFFDFNTPITTNTVSTEIVNALSIDDYNVSQLEYFPNPVKDRLRLKYSSTIEVVEITDILGNRVYSSNFNASEIELDLSELATSMYFVTIKSENNQMVIKILKE